MYQIEVAVEKQGVRDGEIPLRLAVNRANSELLDPCSTEYVPTPEAVEEFKGSGRPFSTRQVTYYRESREQFTFFLLVYGGC